MARKKSTEPAVALDQIPPKSASAEWSEKEHIAEPAIVAAQHLLEAAGSLEIAQQALATVARRKSTPPPRSRRSASR